MIMRMERKFLFLLLPLSLIALALIMVSSLAYSSPISGSNINTNNIETRFTFDAPEFHEFKEYDIVKIKGCSLTTNIGEPKLPVKTKIVFIQESSTIVDIVVLTEKEEIEGNYTIYPTQPPRTITNVTKTNASFVVNHTVYNSSSPYPEKIVEYSEGGMVNRKLVTISIYPIQYIPKEGKIVFHRNISISLKTKCSGVPLSPSLLPLIESGEGTEFLGTLSHSLTENNLNSLGLLSAGDTESKYKYIIITGGELEESFNVLADWKTKKGVPAAVFNTTFINDSYEGVDLQAKIRNFIQDAHLNWSTEWVLLGGDTDVVPWRGAYGMVNGEQPLTDIPADLYYSCLNGTWDADDDKIYGEVDDDVNLSPNVFVGRAPVDTVGEACTFVNKTLLYEKNPPVDYQLNILFLAEKLCPPPSDCTLTYGGNAKDEIDINLSYIPSQFTITKKYERDSNANKTIAINEMNNGRPHIVNHVGHGGYTYFSVNGGIDRGDASSLTNNPRNFILYTMSCMSNGFDQDSVSEHYMNNPNGGTVAYIGNSRYGWFEPGHPGEGPSDKYDQQFFNCLNCSIYNIGATLACSKIVYIQDSQNDSDGMRWIQYSLNLLGDPELPIWTEEPKELNVSYDYDYDHDGTGKRRIDIRVKEESGGVFEPLEGALVCLHGENTYVYGHTNSAGGIIFETPLEENLNLTVTKHNFLPNETIIAGLKHDINVTTDYAGAVNGIRIENVATGENVSEGENLTIGETYNISYKIVNEGDFNETSISVTVRFGNTTTGWNETIETHNYSLHIGDSDTYFDVWHIAGLAEGIYNITVNASIASEDAYLEDNERTREVMLEMPRVKPNITSWYPREPIVNDTAEEGESRTFKVATNQTVNVTWYINGSEVHTNTSVPAEVNATYTNASAVAGAWNVSAIVSNENGTDMHTWNWTVEAAKHDVNVSTDYEGAIGGIKITKNGEEVVKADENLTIGQLYKIHYKIVNDGNVKEDSVNITVTIRNSTGWNDTRWHNFSLGVNESKTDNVSWSTTGLAEGNYTIYVNASTPIDNNWSNNNRSREIFAALENSPSPCFIATAAYGTPLHDDIDVLRDFRDEYLMTNPFGRLFVKIYYTTSPTIAEVIRENAGLRMAVREGFVKPLVYIVKGL